MKYCQECGKEMFDDSVICPNCGTYQTELKRVEAAEPVDEAEEVAEAAVAEVDAVAEVAAVAEEAAEAAVTEVAAVAEDATVAVETEATKAVEEAAEPFTRPTGSPFAQSGPSSQFGAGANLNMPSYSSGAAYTYGAPGDSGSEGDTRFNVPTGGAGYPIQRYNFWLYFFLGIVTCGIFNIYYMYKWTEDMNRLSQGVYKPSMNYIFVFLLGIVTCGIYPLVWIYQQGERVKVVGDANGVKINETGVHHLLITLLLGGVGGLVSQYIFFSNTNRLSAVYNGTMTRDAVNVKTSHIPAIIIGVVAAILTGSVALGSMIYVARNEANSYSNYNYDYDYDFNDFNIDDFNLEDFDEFIDMDEGGIMSEIAMFDNSYIEIVNAYKTTDANGDPALLVDFHWENFGEERNSAMWVFDIKATQNGQVLESTMPAPNSSAIDMESYGVEVGPFEGRDFQLMFKLLNESDDVQVTAKEFLSNSNSTAGCLFHL